METKECMRSHKRKRNNSDKGSRHLPLVVKDSINRLFERKFIYKRTENDQDPNTGATLPAVTEDNKDGWEIPKYMAMKLELNSLKDNLNDKNMVTWHEHTRAVNLAGFISVQIKARFRPEMCTQAWCKFYEIASTYLQIDAEAPFFSVHLCEAPGAFVTSLNHYLLSTGSTGYKGNWSWLATTLNPYYEGNSIRQMIDDDKFIRSSHNNWFFGVDGTGNLMCKENLAGLVQKLQGTTVNLVTADGSIDCQDDPAEQENVVCRLQYCEALTAMHILSPGGIHVTADGSIDCQDDPAEQENVVCRLQYCETLTAMHILSPGGTLVIKMFTLFECRSICLMYLLYNVFEKVNAFKPCTSKGGNSEVYVVCQGYKGKEFCQSYLTILTDKYFGASDPEGCIFPLSEIPASFLDQHTRCAEFYKDCQMTSIQRNLDLYKVTAESEERSRLDLEKEYCAEGFFSRYRLEPMVGKARIMRTNKRGQGRTHKPSQGDFASKVRLEGKFTGSFQERTQMLQLPWQQKVLGYETFEEEVQVEDNSLWIRSMEGPLSDKDVERFTLQTGCPVDRIQSSRLCHDFYITRTQEILENVQWLKDKTETSPELTEIIIKHLLTVLKTALQYIDPGGQDMNQSDAKNRNTKPLDHQEDKTGSSFISWQGWAESSDKLLQESIEMSQEVNVEETDKDSNCRIPSQEMVAIKTNVKDTENGDCHVAMTTEDGDCDMVDASGDAKGDSRSVTESHKCSPSGTNRQTIGSTEQSKVEVEDAANYPDNAKCNLPDETGAGVKYCFKCYCKSSHSKLCQGLSKAALDTGPKVRLYSVHSDNLAGNFELTDQKLLCHSVRDMLQTCGWGDTVVIEMGTSLSRVTAGLVYLLYRSFTEIGFLHHHGNLLRRHLVCVGYQGCPTTLHQCLADACQRMDQDHTEAVLEIVSLYTVLEDPEFTSFLHISNTNLLQSFITTAVNREKNLYSDQDQR